MFLNHIINTVLLSAAVKFTPRLLLCYKTIGIQTLSNFLHILEPTVSAPDVSLTAKRQFLIIIVNRWSAEFLVKI